MPINIWLASFAGGEYSPAIYPRVDLEKYKSGLKTCRNFIIHPTGGASNRCGSQYIDDARYDDSMCIAQEFIFNQDQAYVLEFGHLYVRFYTNGAQIQSSGSAYQVETPYRHSDLTSLRFESSADVIFITHPDYITRTLSRYAESNWVLETYEPDDGPFMPENILDNSSMSIAAVTGEDVTLSVGTVTNIDTAISLLLHMNGVDASTTFTDAMGKSVTAVGNAQIDTAQQKFGTASGLFDGTGDYLTVPDSADFYMADSDWTIDFWVRFDSVSGCCFFSHSTDSDNYAIGFFDGTSLRFSIKNTGVFTTSYSVTWSPIVNTWYHVAIVRSGGLIKYFIDGAILGSEGSTSTWPNFTGTFNIGNDTTGNGVASYDGWLDEFRISKGVARWTSSFTPQVEEYSTYTVSQVSDFSFDSLHVGALFKLRHYIGGQTISQAFTSATSSSSIKCFTTWRIITHGTWTGKIRIEKSTDGGTTWTALRTFSSTDDFNANTSGTEDIEANPVPFLIRANMYSYTSGTCNVDLTTDPFYQEGIVRVVDYVSPTSVLVDVLQEVGSTSSTLTWSEGSWSAYRGYPSIARFFQDRLCFANTDSEPQTIWTTKTSDYYSFIRNQTLLDTDGITINLPSRQLNAINGLIAFKKLLAFTSASVWSIGPVQSSALTPTSVQTDVEDYAGSADIIQQVIGTEAFYVQADNQSVRNIGYRLDNDGFTGSETNILCKHLFEGYTITKMAYQRRPNSVLWCLRSDGVLLGMTYLAEQEVVAWTHHDTDGTIESICVIPTSTTDELWMTIDRDNGRTVEKMDGRKQFSVSDHVFMDSFIEIENSTLVISATHLANQTVAILGDGEVLDQQTVSASGTLAMSDTYSVAYVGLPYYADLETLNIEVPVQDGSIQGSMIKIGNVVFRLVNTRGGWVGPKEDVLYEAFDYDKLTAHNFIDNDEALGITDNFSGDVRVPLGSEYKRGGRVFYRQVDPCPVTIGAISPEAEIGGRKS